MHLFLRPSIPIFYLLAISYLVGYLRKMSSLRAFSLDARLFNADLYSGIINFWFAGLPLPASASKPEQTNRWFGLGSTPAERAAVDSHCRSAFQSALQSLSPEKFTLPSFTDVDSDRRHYPDIAAPFVSQFNDGNAETALGLIILLDQMPRNIFRGNQALIYGHYDRISRAIFQEVYERKLDRHEKYLNSPPWLTFFYMPLMHSESAKDHQLLEQILEDWIKAAEERGDKEATGDLNRTLGSEKKHGDIVLRFGRYPHRNKVLKRESTKEELDWLQTGGDTFGT